MACFLSRLYCSGYKRRHTLHNCSSGHNKTHGFSRPNASYPFGSYHDPGAKLIKTVSIGVQSRAYQPMSPPMTTSPPRTAPVDISWLMELGTTPAVMGNSTGAVLTTRTTLPEPGVSRMQKNDRSRPSSVYSSMTCLLLFGPWSSSMRALSGRPSVLRSTCTESTSGSNGYVRSAPPWMVIDDSATSVDGSSTSLANRR